MSTFGSFTAAALRAAVPAGGRRSKPFPRFFLVSEEFRGPAGRLPAGSRPSPPGGGSRGPALFSIGDARFRGALQNRNSRVNLTMNDWVFSSGYPGIRVSRSEL